MPRRGGEGSSEWSLELVEISEAEQPDGVHHLDLKTNQGVISCRVHAAERGDAAVLWVFGAGGGWGGPAGGLYPRLARQLLHDGVTSLEVAYRLPGDLVACVLDVLMGIGCLAAMGRKRVLLVGHSFGGAVVITAGAQAPNVAGVAALSTQAAGAESVVDLKGKPVLFIHGAADEVLPDRCSRDLYARAGEPKKILLYPGCRHGLDECRDEIDCDLLAWIREVL
ncbi:MAG TPA: alpha/beta hydrolase [Bryobacteraceae bacterium]|nr:alpha/beta hydrolase [Bryobacteraceae bacterium]